MKLCKSKFKIFTNMNSATPSPTALGNSSGRSDSQDSGLNSGSTQTSKILNHMKSEVQVQKQQKKLERELHAKRVQSLRKELEYLKATEWRYQPIDGYK
ncbi:hypothetical protein PV327_007033 [Microctonus hyperodae]|uniref:Uncharacterized protein n=1 Tax=Microctonus hyperodae TaxID=165561 RepID=A0AA39F5I5_MICHY|nr:hypothetical protein PV327_007033 [Microctonus hyperodae]